MSGGSRTDFRPEPIPRDRPADDPVWRQIEGISAALERVVDLAVLTAAPAHPQKGFIRYADGLGWDPGSGAGAYVYNGTAWVFLEGGGGSEAERIIGYYNQVADNVLTGPGSGSPLVPAGDASISPGDIYLLSVTGAFTTSHPALPGNTGNQNDYIISDGNVWGLIVRDSTTYLRKDIADTAAGHITLAAGGTTTAPTLANHIARLTDAQSEAASAVAGHEGNAGAHSGRITALEGRMSTVEAEQVVQNGRLDTLEADWASMQCSCVTVQQDLDAHKADPPGAHPQYVGPPWKVDATTGDLYPDDATKPNAGIGTLDRPVQSVTVGQQAANGIEGGIVYRLVADQGGIAVVGIRQKDFNPSLPPGPQANAPVEIAGSSLMLMGGTHIEVQAEIAVDRYLVLGKSEVLADGRSISPLMVGPEVTYAQEQSAADTRDIEVTDLSNVDIVGMTLTQGYIAGSVFVYTVVLQELGGRTVDFSVEIWLNNVLTYDIPTSLSGNTQLVSDSVVTPDAVPLGTLVELKVSATGTHPQSDGWVAGSVRPSELSISQV